MASRNGEGGGDERTQLISSGRDFEPVDYGGSDGRRRHRCQLCVTGLVVVCVGVAMTLAIALPLANRASSESTVEGGVQAANAGRVLMAGGPEKYGPSTTVAPRNDTTRDPDESDDDDDRRITWPTRPPFPSRRTHRPPYKWTTSSGTTVSTTKDGSTDGSTDFDTTTTTGRTPTEQPPICPKIPKDRRGGKVDMGHVNGSVWYELSRVQTRNSPAYNYEVSCSSMQLNLETPLLATMELSWEEGWLVFRRRKMNKTIELQRNETESASWIESFKTTDEFTNNETKEHGEITFVSLVSLVNDYLLVFECFPDAVWYPKPGYVIRVYSSSPYSGRSGIDDALLAAAQVWGLNPAELYPRRIRQRYCDRDLGYA